MSARASMTPNTAQLAIMCGLPKSGKTAYAKAMQEAGWVRVSSDDIRLALHGRQMYAPAEDLVWAIAKLAVRALLLGGHRVVVDATNKTKERRASWVEIAHEFDVSLEALVMETSVEECHRRNNASEKPVPSEVIDRMAKQWEPVEEEGACVRMVASDEGAAG